MFTGLVEEVGLVVATEPFGNGVAFTIRASAVLDGLRLGDSISVDGVCQTVTAERPETFSVQAVETTLSRTTLGTYGVGRRVNLERSLAVGDRLGGHLVQGHVDGVGRVLSIVPRDELVLIDLSLPDEVAQVTVLHGSITVQGVSLTVNAIPAPSTCQLSIIPHTWQHTAFPDLREGDPVNVEGDLIGKYVRHLLAAPGAGADLRQTWGY